MITDPNFKYLEPLLLFIVGLLVDLFVTYYNKAIADRKKVHASLLSGTVTFINYTVIVLIVRVETFGALWNILCYAMGNTVGTYLAMSKEIYKRKP